MTWNYRIIYHKLPVETNSYYALHEVHYDRRGRVADWTEQFDIVGDSPADILAQLAQMQHDCHRYYGHHLDAEQLERDASRWDRLLRRAIADWWDNLRTRSWK